MRKAISVAMGLLLLAATPKLARGVEMTWEFSVQVSATVQASPSRITLNWPQDQYMLPNGYTVYRKAPNATSWGTGVNLPGTATSYVDNNVVVGTAYEYQIVKSTSQYTGYGYLCAGINVPMTDYRGKLLLVVDSTYASALTNELAQLRQDLVGDGWTVIRLDVGRNDSVDSVKAKIKAQYTADPTNVKSVFLFGHVPVPYSGDIVPDGHIPNHQGAWPCDGYYGDMDGTWTDTTVNDTGADEARNHNVPGDGKFDQSTFPAAIKLMVGRVDLANLPGELWYGGPTTLPSELELLRNYLNKDHKYRTKQFNLPQRGIVGDFIGTRNGEAFAASAYRNFAPFFGANNVTNVQAQGAWTPTLKNSPYLWAYGCGAGSLASVAGLGNSDSYFNVTTPELYTNDIKAVFTMFFGSWLGDWDGKDDIMRCALALPSYGLAAAWSGRPHWFLQHMGLGETIGFGARLTQNNGANGLYQNEINTAAGQIHVALMGDPTLRLHVVAPPGTVSASPHGNALALSWAPSPDNVVGYHVYRANNDGTFTRLTTTPVTTTKYNDQTGSAASNYMVRAVSLQTSPSGSYYNPSVGTFLVPVTTSATTVGGTGTQSGGTQTGGTGTQTNTNSTGVVTTNPPTANTLINGVVWVDDALPAGAVAGTDGGDAWNWVSSNPSPYSGTAANQSTLAAGLHQHYFSSATQTLAVNTGDTMFAAVYLDPNNPPSEIMLQWNDGSSWDHRAFWGANSINYGTLGTASQYYLGPLPTAGQWTLLRIPASDVGLEGSTVNGMSFSQVDGAATWDYAGKFASGGSVSQPSSGSSGGGSTVTTTNAPSTLTNATLWVEDALPAGAVSGADGGDAWNWVNANPAPYSGSLANQATVAAGLHQHYFTSATQPLPVSIGDTLFAAVYLDPNNPPSEIMLQWNDGSWEHRAFWGANTITYGTLGTASRINMGGLPASGRWTLLEIPASLVALEGSTVTGMSFSQVDGAATWDYIGKVPSGSTVPIPGSGGTITSTGGSGDTNTAIGGTGTTTTGGSTGATTGTGTGTSTGGTASSGGSTNLPAAVTNSLPGSSVVDYLGLQVPPVGANSLHVLSPNLLELNLITTKQPDPATVTQWNFVDANSQLTLPPTSAFQVTVDGQAVGVATIGFKRRPLYAPNSGYDLRIMNSLYLQLASPISDNQTIQVLNPDGTLWSSSMQFVSKVDPLRYSPAIHVNQEGYMPNYSKTAMVGYYAGSMGEVSVPASAGFKIVDANTGSQVYQGSLVGRLDSGYVYVPTPYQKVYQADFSSFNTPGQYRLVVPGMGASLPFLIHDGVAMDFARGYALGLYHQRCGTNTAMPQTRFTHDICHAAPASVPASATSYPFTWTTIAGYASNLNPNNPPQIAPALTSPTAQLFPFVNQGPLDVSGGHHDAGDYSKYTSNSASLIAYLMFAVDSLPGVASLDNLGIPESGDGISDVMQEAKWEADFLAKMQDSDGGFYFLVYPKDREYESNVTPDHGDPQVVWPKTTSVTAASVAALAQCATSPLFKKTYPAAAASYLAKAKLGWQFLTTAIAKYGKNGAYQKITHYGDNFADNDELAWAACQMYLATGDSSIHQLLLSWFDPADPATWRWGWWHMSECYGHAIRSYAFAVQSGRATASQLDATFLSKCQTQISAGGDDVMNFSQENAYGTSFPLNTKAVQGGGWYFSTDQAFDLAVAYQLNPKPQYMEALMANVNYEGGCNPLNLCYVTGLGWKRQRDIVSQWALNDTRVLPPSGIPVGNIEVTFGYDYYYGGELKALCFPSDDGSTVAPYPFYDRWGDSWNVSSEMVVLNQARSIGTLAFLAAQTSYKSQAWQAPANAQIVVPTTIVPVGQPVTLSMQVPGIDLTPARITWEARDQEPAFGATFTYSPKNNGVQWVEAEAQMPDGRRIFAKASYSANSPNIVWVDDSLPTGAIPGSDGGDSWNWVSSNPTPFSGTLEQRSANMAGSHQHYFANATATMSIGTGDVLYAYVYLDPSAMPSEIMLQWNDGTWDHRAYWGADNLGYGVDGTATRRYMGPLPAAGQWVQLKVPASQVNLEGSTVSGMGFALFGGSASWDAAGRLSASAGTVASTVTLKTTNSVVSRITGSPTVITFSRAGDTTSPLVVNYSLNGSAVNGQDYQLSPTFSGSSMSIPAGASSADLLVQPLTSSNMVGPLSIHFAVQSNSTYSIGAPGTVDVSISGNTVPASLRLSTSGAILTWSSNSSKQYHVAYKNNLTDANWTVIGQVTANATVSSWTDNSPGAAGQRFYMVAQVN